MTDTFTAGIFIAAATVCAGKGIGAVMASRRAPAKEAGRGQRAQKWQWLALAVLQAALGIHLLTYSPRHGGISWWFVAGSVALLIWMLMTDVVPWLRSRLKPNTGTS